MLKLLMVKISVIIKIVNIANLIGNPMMEEYYADLALKQLNSDTSLWIKKVAIFFIKV
ncbi:hypothetical protein [Caldicellulosiruptor naganoensis]|uniref:hypothetical protein n=1 Tax=Caldicellulosiruptor naganoensis TaxID=29324 RepID=UPI000AF14B0B|nr:hypothetical protein [Caldicellulosiruptor naganoensis]